MNGDRLAQAIEAAEARKGAALATADSGAGPSINFTTEDQSRAIISGFDIDYDELRVIAERAGRFFATMSLELSTVHTHAAAWTEGLLVGLFAGCLPPPSDVSDTEVTGTEDPDGLR